MDWLMFEFPLLDHDQNLINCFLTQGLCTTFHGNRIIDFSDTSLTDWQNQQWEQINSFVKLIITVDCQRSLSEAAFIKFIWDRMCKQMGVHWRNFALSLLYSGLPLTTQLCLVSGEHSGMIQTLNVTQSGALHLMPLCETPSVTKAVRCSWGFGASSLLLLLLLLCS